ncbi:MAG: type II toxin-antitoxin system HicB family antitoxin [Thermoanaerobaculia bacterium]
MPLTKDLAHYLRIKYPMMVREGPDGGYFVTHPDLDGCMAEGATLAEAAANLADSRELWIETRLANGYTVPEPVSEEHSGRISLRMSASLHAQLAEIAERRGISLNLLINTVLASFAGGEDPLQATIRDLRELLNRLGAAQAVPTHRATPGIGEVDLLQQAASSKHPRRA